MRIRSILPSVLSTLGWKTVSFRFYALYISCFWDTSYSRPYRWIKLKISPILQPHSQSMFCTKVHGLNLSAPSLQFEDVYRRCFLNTGFNNRFHCYYVDVTASTMALLRASLTLPRSGTVFYFMWLVFVTSFIWFPYLGMISTPCQRGSSLNNVSFLSWFQHQKGPQEDYTIIMPLSTINHSFVEIMKDQEERLTSFCSKHSMPTTVYGEQELKDLLHHILVDDDRKLLFCYIPKVGCSNWKRVFLILAGLVGTNQGTRPSIEVFRQVNSLENYTPKEQEHRLRTYFKFMFIRHPPERVLSAYRNKIEHPLITNPIEQSIWDEVRYAVLTSYRIKFNNMIAKGETNIYPTFAEFLHFLYDSDPVSMNEHYKPMVELCQPCAVRYNFIGNFATLRSHADAVLSYLCINSTMFWDKGKHRSNPTLSYIKQYYSKLQPIDFQRLEERFAYDIDLYNHLFPFSDDGGYTQIKADC